MWGNIKSSYKTVKLKYQLQGGMMNLNYQVDHILSQIFDYIIKNHETFAVTTNKNIY